MILFENKVFLFFDRSRSINPFSKTKIKTQWNRWYEKVVNKQIKSCNGAEKYIRSGKKMFFDNKRSREIPFQFNSENLNVHKIILTHGIREACLEHSRNNINGSLGIIYGSTNDLPNDNNIITQFTKNHTPFTVYLEKDNPIHIFDTHNLDIILRELDTISDFADYIMEKEKAIKEYETLVYSGEEDLLAYYLCNYNEENNRYYIFR
jgi:predicted secreted acid phosphatase